MKTGLTALAMGLLLLWVGWNHWQYRRQETISILEKAILDVFGEQPLPRTKIDSLLKYLQAVLGFVIGSFFTLLGILIIFNELELL